MTIHSLWENREDRYNKKLAKYMKYVLNDHMLLFIGLLLGGVLYAYTQFLPQVEPYQPLISILLMVIFAALPFSGAYASHVLPADQVYLAPLEKELTDVLHQRMVKSAWLPILIQGGLLAILLPLILATFQWRPTDYFYGLGMIIAFKGTDLMIQVLALKYQNLPLRLFKPALFLVGLLAYGIAFYVRPLYGLVLALASFALLFYLFYREKDALWSFDALVDKEAQRRQRLLKILNLFIDVPAVQVKAKRRAFLDPLADRLSGLTAYSFVFPRVFLRTSYGNLFLRLVLVGALAVGLAQNEWLALLLGILFQFLLYFQLAGLVNHYKGHPNQWILDMEGSKIEAVKRLLRPLVFLSGLVFSVVGLVTLGWSFGLISFVLFSGLGIIFVEIFVKRADRDKA